MPDNAFDRRRRRTRGSGYTTGYHYTGDADSPSRGAPVASGGLIPITRKDGGEPCGECHLRPGETCDICGAVQPELDKASPAMLAYLARKTVGVGMPQTKINVIAKDAQDVATQIADIIEHRARNEQNLANLTDQDGERYRAQYAGDVLMEVAKQVRNILVTVAP